MGLRDLLDKGKCLIGLHQGEWKAASPTSCMYTRVCERCGAEHHKTEHVWQPWGFVADGACDQARTCGRCASREERVSHAWGEPTWVSSEGCEQHVVCGRCKAAKEAPVRHVMDQWRYVSADDCTQVQQCSRCRADGSGQRMEHAWGDWQHSNAHNGPVRVCRRCGEMQVPSAPSPGAAPATPRPVRPEARSRQEMFDALKPKMDELAEQEAAMGRILAAMEADAAKALGAIDAEDSPPTPPTVSDDDVADLLARAQGTQQPAAAGQVDPRLVGHWRCTEVISSGGFSLVTDIHVVLDTDGRFARWSHSESGLGGSRSDPEYGSWRSQQGSLVLDYDDGTRSAQAFELHQNQLFLPQASSQRLWDRVG
jgi:hypothetical protein